MTVVSVVYDYRTVLAAGGGRAEFELVYGVARTRDLLAIAAPALIAILAISQQLATGEGLDSIQGIVESLPSIVPAGR